MILALVDETDAVAVTAVDNVGSPEVVVSTELVVVSDKLVVTVDDDKLVCTVDTGSEVVEVASIEVVSNEVGTVVVEVLAVEQSSHCTHSPVASSKIKPLLQTQMGCGI